VKATEVTVVWWKVIVAYRRVDGLVTCLYTGISYEPNAQKRVGYEKTVILLTESQTSPIGRENR